MPRIGSLRPCPARPSRPTRRCTDQAAQGLGRAREDPRVVRALLARPGGRRTWHRPGRHRDRAVHRGPVDRAACLGRADRVPVRPAVGAELGGCVLPDPCRWQAGRRGRRPRDRRRSRSHERLLGRPAETHVGRRQRRGRAGARGVLLDLLEQASETELAPAARPRSSADMPRGVSRRSPRASSLTTAASARPDESFEDPHVIPSDNDAVRALDGARDRAGRLLPRAGTVPGSRTSSSSRPRAASSSDGDRRGCNGALSRVHHTSYTVSDLDRSLAFYCDTARLRDHRDAGEGGRVSRRHRRSSGRPCPDGAPPRAGRGARDRAVRVRDTERHPGRRSSRGTSGPRTSASSSPTFRRSTHELSRRA